MLWQLLKESCAAQAAHNDEYEAKYSKEKRHELASMQQQYKHGLYWTLERMRALEEEINTSTKRRWIITPAPLKFGKPRCRMSRKLERLIAETIRELKGRKMKR